MDSFFFSFQKYFTKNFKFYSLNFLFLLSTLLISQAYALDCTHITSPSQKTICSHEKLKQLNQVLDKNYAKLISTKTPDPELRNLEDEQQQWLGKMTHHCKTNKICLEKTLIQRIQALNELITKTKSLSDQKIVINCLQKEEIIKPRPFHELSAVFGELKKIALNAKTEDLKKHGRIINATGNEQNNNVSMFPNISLLEAHEKSLKQKGYLFVSDIDNDGQEEYIILTQGKDSKNYIFVLKKIENQFKYVGEPPRPPDCGDGPWYFYINRDKKSGAPAFLTKSCEKIYMNFSTPQIGKEIYLWENGINQPIQINGISQ